MMHHSTICRMMCNAAGLLRPVRSVRAFRTRGAERDARPLRTPRAEQSARLNFCA